MTQFQVFFLQPVHGDRAFGPFAEGSQCPGMVKVDMGQHNQGEVVHSDAVLIQLAGQGREIGRAAGVNQNILFSTQEKGIGHQKFQMNNLCHRGIFW